MRLFDMNHDWLRPLWVRVLIVVVAGGWGVFEWINEQYVWAMIFLVRAGYAVWSFFLAPGSRGEEERQDGREDDDR